MNKRMIPPGEPVLMPKACICCGIGSPWLRFNASSAPIILPVPGKVGTAAIGAEFAPAGDTN